MKSLIICGLTGTGKTTISKDICYELGFKYLDLYDKIQITFDTKDKEKASAILFKKIDQCLGELYNENCIIDCDYLIMPKEYDKLKFKDKYDIIYLGFNTIDLNTLVKMFKEYLENKNLKYSFNELIKKSKYFKKISEIVYEDCRKYGIKYFDISKDKKIMIDEVKQYIYSLLKNQE